MYAVNAPLIALETMSVIAPYIPVAEKTASLATQLAAGQMGDIEIEYLGEIAQHDTTPLKAAVIKGLLAPISEENVTIVNAALVAEHFHDASGDLAGDGWHANMNYSAFTRPAWTWLSPPDSPVPYLGLPVRTPRRGGHDVVATMREFDAVLPWRVTASQWNMLGSHDTPRLRSIVGSRWLRRR